MTYKFNINNKNKLDTAERRSIMPPYETLEKLGLKNGDVMADVGCGIGYFTIPASDIVGQHSQVYAMDISSEMLEDVEKKSKELGKTNICTIKIEETDFKVADNICDFVLISNVIHELDDTSIFLHEVYRILKFSGKIAIIDWKYLNEECGPSVEHRISLASMLNLIEDFGITVENSFDLSPHHYCVNGIKTK